MSEYVTQAEIDQMLGLTPETQALDDFKDARIEVIERETAPDSSEANDDGLRGEALPKTAKVEEVLAQPDGHHKAVSTEHEKTVAEEDIIQTTVTNLERRLGKKLCNL